jgi:GWxTD domain-containing protein
MTSAMALTLLLVVNACAKPRPTGDPGGVAPAGAAPGGAPGAPGAGGSTTAGDMQRLYRNMGLVAGAATLPFVASVSFLPTPTPDSTLVLLSLSLPSRALGFGREGERYIAGYVARVELRRGPTVVRTIEANETVRVPTFRETARTDESIIWQQFIRVAPGRYSMSVAIRDEGGLRNAAEDVTLDVPPMRIGALASPVAVYEAIPRQSADSLPRLLARPRSTVIFGQDSVLPLYIDAVGATAPTRVDVRVLGEGDMVSWTNSIELPQRGNARSTTITIPVTRMGVGLNTVQVAIPGTADTVRTRVLVTLGDDLPIANFDEMLAYLRYFTTADRLKPLRDATPAQRAEAWITFLRETDPVPATAEHEGLRDYFGRIRTANTRYRDDAQVGWQSDRGIAYVALGDPDNIVDTGLIDPNARVRQQIWEYRELRVQLLFVDQTGFGRWRLNAQGRADLDNAIRRKMAQRDQ